MQTQPDSGNYADYGWIITRETGLTPVDAKGAAGTYGPRAIAPDLKERLLAGENGVVWRLRDDDGETLYLGRFVARTPRAWESESGFGPLDDYGIRYGATSVEYLDDQTGEWVYL